MDGPMDWGTGGGSIGRDYREEGRRIRKDRRADRRTGAGREREEEGTEGGDTG